MQFDKIRLSYSWKSGHHMDQNNAGVQEVLWGLWVVRVRGGGAGSSFNNAVSYQNVQFAILDH